MDSSDRSKTPAERASKFVYGSPKAEDDDLEHQFSARAITPQVRPSSRIEKVIGKVVDVAEDMVTGGNPNLAKMWNQAYQHEKDEDKAMSRGTTPRFVIDEGQYVDSDCLNHLISEIHYESLSTSSSTSEVNAREELANEETPMLRKQDQQQSTSFIKTQYLAFIKLLSALFPFFGGFRSLSLPRKIFYIIKVSHKQIDMYIYYI